MTCFVHKLYDLMCSQLVWFVVVAMCNMYDLFCSQFVRSVVFTSYMICCVYKLYDLMYLQFVLSVCSQFITSLVSLICKICKLSFVFNLYDQVNKQFVWSSLVLVYSQFVRSVAFTSYMLCGVFNFRMIYLIKKSFVYKICKFCLFNTSMIRVYHLISQEKYEIAQPKLRCGYSLSI